MSRGLSISAKAQDDLVEIWRWTFQAFGEIQADRYLGELGEAMNACALAPKRGRDRSEIRDGYRSVLVGRHVGSTHSRRFRSSSFACCMGVWILVRG
ncbi:MAG: plasmid stabilization protein [Phycisphaerae bacterium]|nr:plasmid stabilization protein [Phycisphaerae bacterium]MBM90617.1 plasmid stabilization protein [Phycisphaerae bacterium]HCT44884.1 type II toxin-antitoxin system RelE/ParE family toxin [Phycisphaerales bacterium]